MRRSVMVVAAAAMVAAVGGPAWAADARPPGSHTVMAQEHRADDPGPPPGDSRYRHHDRYRGDRYDYPDHQEPYWEDGPYDGYYDCWRSPGPRHSETWCDHYWGSREPA